jgi:hypothetical protein
MGSFEPGVRRGEPRIKSSLDDRRENLVACCLSGEGIAHVSLEIGGGYPQHRDRREAGQSCGLPAEGRAAVCSKAARNELDLVCRWASSGPRAFWPAPASRHVTDAVHARHRIT